MPIYTVTWAERTLCFASIEADSPEEAIEKAKAGEYDNADSEPGPKDSRSYRATEGENGYAPIRRKRP